MGKNLLSNLNLKHMNNNNTIRLLIVLIFCILQCSCIEENENEIANTVRATGTYGLEYVDKNIWGDFQLILEINKATYLYKDKILTNLCFHNIGAKPIELSKVISETQMNNPPEIDIWTADGRKYKIFEVVKGLSDSILIEPEKSIVLMKFDLTAVGGFVYRKDTIDGYILYKGFEYPSIGSEFTKGIYFMRAAFFPVPQIYGCVTDTISFEIR